MTSLVGPKPAASSSAGFKGGLLRLWRLLRGGQSSPTKVALSCGLGLFVGCLPVYGVHFVICAALCFLFRLDLMLMYLAANISNPFVAPFLVTAEVEVGSYLLHGRFVGFDVERARALGASGFFAQAVLGSLVVGSMLAGAGGGLAWLLASRRTGASSPLDRARERTLARYRGARIADRKYVEGKLHYDPVLERIAELELDLGAVIDAGAGRGQLGLCLLELGQARSLRGFDLDARKIAIARDAAGAAAHFEAGDLTAADLSGFDTLLLVDVLHYLGATDQDALLSRAARELAPGGRLLIRDTDGARKRGGLLTRALERIARATGWHRGNQPLCFRPLAAIVRELEAGGLSCRVLDASGGTPFENQLVIAEKPTTPAGGADGELIRARTSGS